MNTNPARPGSGGWERGIARRLAFVSFAGRTQVSRHLVQWPVQTAGFGPNGFGNVNLSQVDDDVDGAEDTGGQFHLFCRFAL